MSRTLDTEIRQFAEYVMARGRREFKPIAYFNLNPGQKAWLSRQTYALYDRRMRKIDSDKAEKAPFSSARLFGQHPVPNSPPPQELVTLIHGLRQVEVYIPDYSTLILEVVREEFARALFATTWAGEEANHNLWLKWWLLYRGAATEEECFERDRDNLSHRWDPRKINPNFGDPLYVLGYTAFQEKYTAIAYERMGYLAERAGEWALAELCRQLKAEEISHHLFYLDVCKLVQQLAPEAFAALIHSVHDEFDMPASYIENLENYSGWTALAQTMGMSPDFRWAVGQWMRFAVGTLKRLTDSDAITNWKEKATAWDRYVRGIGDIFRQLQISPLPPDLLLERRTASLGELILPSSSQLVHAR